MALDAQMQVPIHSSPMLQVNYPLLHDIGLTHPLAILKPTPLITPINPTHKCEARISKRHHHHIGTVLGQIQETVSRRWVCRANLCVLAENGNWRESSILYQARLLSEQNKTCAYSQKTWKQTLQNCTILASYSGALTGSLGTISWYKTYLILLSL